jgi:uncharacterized protein (TIGR00156 family)
MKEYTFFFVCCLITLIAASTVSAQGFTGPGANPTPPSGPGYNPPPPPDLGHYPLPPAPPFGPGFIPPPPPPPHHGGPGHYPPPPPPHHGGSGRHYPPPPPVEGITDQYGFTGPVRTVTVEEAKTYAHRTPVIVTGTIVQAVGGDLYIFRDSSGEITLRIGPREWYVLGSNIGLSDKIEISGELHRDHMDRQRAPEIHARYIRKL